MDTARIESDGRVFSALSLGWVSAESIWKQGSSSDKVFRPIWSVFAGTGLRPFVANIQRGTKVAMYSGSHKQSNRLEYLKSVHYTVDWQFTPYGELATVYQADFFQIDPGIIDPQSVTFAMVLPKDVSQDIKITEKMLLRTTNLLESVSWTLTSRIELSIPQFIRLAHWFGLYLNGRTRYPLLTDAMFYVTLFHRCLELGYACFVTRDRCDTGWGQNNHRSGAFADGMKHLNQVAVVMHCTHEEVEKLIEETTLSMVGRAA